MPGGAMMVSPSTELPRKCGRWEVCGIFSCPPSMEIGRKHARWYDGCPTFHRIAAEVWQVGRLWYLFLPTFHGNRRKACQVVRWMSHLPQNCRGSVAGGYLEGRGKHVWLGIYGIIHVRCIIMLSRGIIQCVSSIHVRCIIMLSRGVIQGVSSSP